MLVSKHTATILHRAAEILVNGHDGDHTVYGCFAIRWASWEVLPSTEWLERYNEQDFAYNLYRRAGVELYGFVPYEEDEEPQPWFFNTASDHPQADQALVCRVASFNRAVELAKEYHENS